jgi:hypothetical protein
VVISENYFLAFNFLFGFAFCDGILDSGLTSKDKYVDLVRFFTSSHEEDLILPCLYKADLVLISDFCSDVIMVVDLRIKSSHQVIQYF